MPRGHQKNPKAGKWKSPAQKTVDPQDVPVTVKSTPYAESRLPFPTVMVEWIDAAHMRGELPADDLPTAFKVPLLQSVGYLAHQEADFIVIAQEWTPATRDFRFLMRIPRVCVKKVYHLAEVQ